MSVENEEQFHHLMGLAEKARAEASRRSNRLGRKAKPGGGFEQERREREAAVIEQYFKLAAIYREMADAVRPQQ